MDSKSKLNVMHLIIAIILVAIIYAVYIYIKKPWNKKFLVETAYSVMNQFEQQNPSLFNENNRTYEGYTVNTDCQKISLVRQYKYTATDFKTLCYKIAEISSDIPSKNYDFDIKRCDSEVINPIRENEPTNLFLAYKARRNIFVPEDYGSRLSVKLVNYLDKNQLKTRVEYRMTNSKTYKLNEIDYEDNCYFSKQKIIKEDPEGYIYE